ncbi:unnamed protein product [Moneuplotes crassus]|uniref:Uncharacterized protein n=1 Tax=Euplotes crassus TaxID=5936 RepID=A0AAD1YAC8_EUPCR|nr:unnamed protein product [Moneuplotes crassus]
MFRTKSSFTNNEDFAFESKETHDLDSLNKPDTLLTDAIEPVKQSPFQLKVASSNWHFCLNGACLSDDNDAEESYFSIPKSNLFKEYLDDLQCEEANHQDYLANFMHETQDQEPCVDKLNFEGPLIQAKACIYEEEHLKHTNFIPNLKPEIKSEVKPESKPSHKITRWRKQDDIELFKAFRMCEQQGLITLNEIRCFKSPSEVAAHLGIQMIKDTLGCKQSHMFLVNRIKNKLNDSFSIRETKLLKRLVRKYEYDNIPYLQLLESFSGKTLEGMKRACDHLCENKRNKKLSKVQQA